VRSRHLPFLVTVGLTAASVVYGQADSAAIEQARLRQKQQPVGVTANVDANGTALPDSEGDASDESFGAQLILKDQPHWRPFQVFGDASFTYTDNVALTRRATMSDGLFVGGGGLAWSPKLSGGFDLQIVGRASTFQYFETSELDFTDLGAGIGLSYTFPKTPSVSVFGRYDFIELLDNSSHQILSDHEFTVGLQKVFVLGRSHYFTLGVLGSAGISDPFSEQRDQVSGFVGYHLNVTRSVSTDLLYRLSGHFYNDGDRSDVNNVLTWTMRYQMNRYAELSSFLTFADNRSNHAVFDYKVFTLGGGIAFSVKF